MARRLLAGLFVAVLVGCSAPAPGVAPPAASPTVAADPDCVPVGAAASAAGRWATVCGPLAEVAYRPGTAGQATFLNFGRPDPNPAFVAVVRGEHRPKFDPPPEARFRPGQRPGVSGRVELDRGTPQVEVTDPAQIRPG